MGTVSESTSQTSWSKIKVIVELKAMKALAPEHQAQVINYLKATGMAVGLLINFGHPKLEYRRLYGPETKLGGNVQDKQI